MKSGQSVSREELLNQLEAVSPGLSIKAEFEQSHCFVFADKKIHTYNDEVCCEHDSCLNGITGAVHAKPLMEMLQKMTESTIKVDSKDEKLIVREKKRQASIACHSNIVLDYKEPGDPGEWHKLDTDFLEGLGMVAECASDDQSAYVYTCVRITPDYVEAMDNWQAGRFMIESPVSEPLYIRKIAVKHVVDLGMEEISIGEQWVHFRSPEGLRLSCRVSRDEDFPDLDNILKVKGKRTKFPKTLVEATERAQIMCEDDDKYIVVSLSAGNMRIASSCQEGEYREDRTLKTYKGPGMSFQISAPLLAKICQKYDSVRVGKDKLGVKVGNFQYVTALKVDQSGE